MKPKRDELRSGFAFTFNLRPYTKGAFALNRISVGARAVLCDDARVMGGVVVEAGAYTVHFSAQPELFLTQNTP